MVSVLSTHLTGELVNCKEPVPNSLSGFLKVMSHETIRNNDFFRNTALQDCYDIFSNSSNIVPLLKAVLR